MTFMVDSMQIFTLYLTIYGLSAVTRNSLSVPEYQEFFNSLCRLIRGQRLADRRLAVCRRRLQISRSYIFLCLRKYRDGEQVNPPYAQRGGLPYALRFAIALKDPLKIDVPAPS